MQHTAQFVGAVADDLAIFSRQRADGAHRDGGAHVLAQFLRYGAQCNPNSGNRPR